METNMEKSKEFFYNLFKTSNAKILAREINGYLCTQSSYHTEVEDYHERMKNGVRTDCIGCISKKGKYKFLSMTSARNVCVVLHFGSKFADRATEVQREIDNLLNRNYSDTDGTKPTKGEAYIRLEWVDDLDSIKIFIDEAYYLRRL